MEKSERSGLVTVGVGLAVLAIVILGLWLLTENISQSAARGWAIIATMLVLAGIPLAAVTGHRAGRQESKAHIQGVEAGIGQVANAAGNVLSAGAAAMDLRLQSLRQTREIIREQPPALPSPNIVILPPSRQGGTLYLDGGGEE